MKQKVKLKNGNTIYFDKAANELKGIYIMENNETQEPNPELMDLSKAFTAAVKKHYPEALIVLCVMTNEGTVINAKPDLEHFGLAEFLKQEIYKAYASES